MKTMTQDINENRGQCAQSGDIRNRGPVTPMGDIAGGLNLIGNQGEIHFHLTLASDEVVAALVDLLKLASTAKQHPA